MKALSLPRASGPSIACLPQWQRERVESAFSPGSSPGTCTICAVRLLVWPPACHAGSRGDQNSYSAPIRAHGLARIQSGLRPAKAGVSRQGETLARREAPARVRDRCWFNRDRVGGAANPIMRDAWWVAAEIQLCVAQAGRALGSEPRGRRIEACHTDQYQEPPVRIRSPEHATV